MSQRGPFFVHLVGSTVLVAVALPPPGPWRGLELGVVGVLALALVQGAPSAGAARRTLAVVGLVGLAVAALLQRPTDPMAGLIVLIGATLFAMHVRARTWLADGAGVLAWACGLGFVALAVPDVVAVPRLPVLVVLGALGGTALVGSAPSLRIPALMDTLMDSPARLLVVSFAGIASVGTALLMLPVASTASGPLALVDAAFTAVSATCVTGLIVLDTPADFTGFGQAVILALIQVGGLGIMAFAAAGSLYLGRRLGLREEAMAAEMMGLSHARRDLEAALRAVLGVTVVSEFLGALALTALFVRAGDGWLQAAWRGLFTAVSAFCNAGFALQSDSLVPYREDAPVLLVVSALIVVGGLGPLVVVALPNLRQPGTTLHVRLVLGATAILLFVPAAAWLALEWNQTLAGLGPVDRLVNAWFQSVTLRTAGFNSLDLASTRPATWTLMLLCMFIGGSPGSTAGGVKTTTFAVLLLAVVAAIRGHEQVEALGRRLPHRTVYEATAITTVGVLAAVVTLAALQLTQQLQLESALFEVVSALGTVGLSIGATGELDAVGKVVIIAAMFAGRVGPLTLFIFLVGRHGTGRRYPLESVPVG